MAVAGTLVAMFASVSAHRYGFEFWGIRTRNLIDSQARMLHWAVTGRPAPPGGDPGARGDAAAYRAGAGRCPAGRRNGAAARRYLRARGLRGEPTPSIKGSGVASSRKV